MLAQLGAMTGLRFVFKTAPDIPTFEKRLSKGEYDFAYMNPYHYVVFSQRPGYRAIARSRGETLHGIVVVQKEAPYQNIHDLADKSVAFPSPAAFAASVLVQAVFAQQGIPIKPEYVSSHDSVYLNVAKGLIPAGGGVMRTFNALDPAIRDRLRILWTTKGYTPHAIAALPGIPASVEKSVQSALEHLSDSPQGRDTLKPMAISGWQAATDSDWDDIRQLDIHLLDNYLKQ
jgi:phosphonate transport system substrate-binding protein